MFILLPQVLQRVRSDTLPIVPQWVGCRVEEVSDLWYERRPGPTSAERRDAKVYGRELPQTGHYSALCHAKFRNTELLLSNSSIPFAPERTLLHVVDNKWEEPDLSLPVWYLSDRYYGFWVIAAGSKTWTYLISITYEGTYGWFSTGLVERACYDADSDTLYTDQTFATLFTKVEARQITFSEVYGLMSPYIKGIDTMPDGERLHPSYEVYPHPGEQDIDYVKALAGRALSAALRYRDCELVNWSVGDSRSYPYALGHIDLLTGRAKAFIDALDDIPLLSENSLQNLAEAFSLLKSFAFGAEETSNVLQRVLKAEMPNDWYRTNARGLTAAQERARRRALDKSALQTTLSAEMFPDFNPDAASDAWLSGRYSFSTSVSDLGQAWSFFYDKALQNIGKRSGDYKCHGVSDDNNLRCCCTFVSQEKALSGVARAFEHCYRYGIEPNAYVLWDFVPFSFVVDWFFPVGDALSAYTKASHFCPEFWSFLPHYDGKAMCYSIKYTSDSFFGPVDVYTRWYEPSPPEVEAAYFLKRSSRAGQSVACKRVLDGLALFHL